MSAFLDAVRLDWTGKAEEQVQRFDERWRRVDDVAEGVFRNKRRTELDCSEPRAVVFGICGENLSQMFAVALSL